MWASCLLTSTLWTECSRVVGWLWYRQAGMSYGQWPKCHFIDCNLNVQRYRDEILRPIVMPFIRRHHIMFQNDNERSHVSRICAQVRKLKMSQFFHGLHTHQTCHPMSMFGMLQINVYDSVLQFSPISSNFAQPLKRSGTTFHRPQSTAWLTLCEEDVSCCMRQRLVTPNTDWFPDRRPYFFKSDLWPTDAYL